MHAGKIATSSRLKDTLAAIYGRWQTTQEIADRTGSVAVHSDVAALRAGGLVVLSRFVRTTEAGRKVYAYCATVPLTETPAGSDSIINPPQGAV